MSTPSDRQPATPDAEPAALTAELQTLRGQLAALVAERANEPDHCDSPPPGSDERADSPPVRAADVVEIGLTARLLAVPLAPFVAAWDAARLIRRAGRAMGHAVVTLARAVGSVLRPAAAAVRIARRTVARSSSRAGLRCSRRRPAPEPPFRRSMGQARVAVRQSTHQIRAALLRRRGRP